MSWHPLFAVVASLLAISGCPRMPRPTDPPRPAPPVAVTSTFVPACVLPPGPQLQAVRASPCPPPLQAQGGVCFDAAAAAALAARLDTLQAWVRQAKAACSAPPARARPADAGPADR